MYKLILSLFVFTALLIACKNTPNAQSAAKDATPATGTVVYSGRIAETLWGDTQVPITVTLDHSTSTFLLNVDYDNTKTQEGEPVNDINDAGTFTKSNDPKWGNLYELSGETVGTMIFQVASNKLFELDHEKMNYTGLELGLK